MDFNSPFTIHHTIYTMPSNDPREFSVRLTKDALCKLLLTESFLRDRKIIKTAPVDENDSPTYYTGADKITLDFGLRRYKPHLVRLHQEFGPGTPPLLIATLDQWIKDDIDQPLPPEMTHAFFCLSPVITESEIEDLVHIKDNLNKRIENNPDKQIEDVNQELANDGYTLPGGAILLRDVLFRHERTARYLKTGQIVREGEDLG